MIHPSSLVFQPVAQIGVAYAGFWRRLGAYLIDATLLLTVEGTLAISILVLGPQNFSLSLPSSADPARAYAMAWDIVAIAEKLGNVAAVSAAISWAYFSILESSPARATVGKAVVGLYVGDTHGDPITFWRASVRYWLKTLSSLLLMAGWLMAAFTPRKQALHDLLAGTLVLRKVTFMGAGPGGRTEPGEYWDGKSWVGAVAPARER